VLPTGAVIFGYNGRHHLVSDPGNPNYLTRHHVEICWADVQRLIETLGVPPPPERIETDKPKPSKQRARRLIYEAIEVLATAADWEDLQAEPRMRRIEKHLEKPNLWCKQRTYHRAIADYQAVQSAEPSATSATSATGTSA
jgi:hypothetical protein